MFPAVVKDKILLVDDQVETRKLLRLALRNLDFTVVEASGAVDALTMVREQKPVVVLLDIVMPGSIDGFEVCEMIKSDPHLKGTYIILISGLNNPNNFYQAQRVGADGYLVKPFPLSKLVDIVKNYQQLQLTSTFVVEGRHSQRANRATT